MTGLRILKTGCQVVNGNQALALVRSRNLQYEVKGVWYNDYGSDFTRIRNQQAFFRAVIHQLNAEITNPIALNDFISAAVHDLTIDQTLTEGTMFNLATGVPQLSARVAQGRDDADRRSLHHLWRCRRAAAGRGRRRRRDQELPRLRQPCEERRDDHAPRHGERNLYVTSTTAARSDDRSCQA